MNKAQSQTQRAGFWDTPWVIPALVFLVALAFRLVFLVQFNCTPFSSPLTEGLDDSFYDQWAWSIASGDWLGRDAFFGMPLYPYFLAVIYFLFGHSYLMVKVAQMLLGAATCVLVYGIGRAVFSRGVGLAAALSLAFYGMSLLYEGLLVGTSLTMFLNAAALLVLLKASESRRTGLWVAGGVLIGLSALNSASALVFLPFAAAWAGVIVYADGKARGSPGGRRAIGLAAAMVVVAFATIAPVTLRNYAVARDFVPISYHGGLNFFIGNNREADGTFQPIPGINPSADRMMIQSRAVAENAAGHRLKPSEVAGYWATRARHDMAQDPGRFLWLLGRKFLLFWNADEIYDIIDYTFVQAQTPVLRLPLLAFGLVGPLGLTGLVLALSSPAELRRRSLLVLFVVTHMVAILLFFVNSRYRLPVVPYLAIFAAFAFWWWCRALRERRFGPVALSLVVLAAALVIAHHKMFTIDYAISHNNLGVVYKNRGMLDDAIQEFQAALRLSPDLQETHSNLGEAYRMLKRYDLAEKEYIEAARIRPAYGAIYYDLGNLYLDMGKLPEAVSNYLTVVRLAPGHAAAYNNLGCVYARQGRREEAVKALQKALEIAPNYQEARRNLQSLQGP